jgi:hypothetical protein
MAICRYFFSEGNEEGVMCVPRAYVVTFTHLFVWLYC